MIERYAFSPLRTTAAPVVRTSTSGPPLIASPSTMSMLSSSVRAPATSGKYQPRGGAGRRVRAGRDLFLDDPLEFLLELPERRAFSGRVGPEAHAAGVDVVAHPDAQGGRQFPLPLPAGRRPEG